MRLQKIIVHTSTAFNKNIPFKLQCFSLHRGIIFPNSAKQKTHLQSHVYKFFALLFLPIFPTPRIPTVFLAIESVFLTNCILKCGLKEIFSILVRSNTKLFCINRMNVIILFQKVIFFTGVEKIYLLLKTIHFYFKFVYEEV